jgi:hypothetical protein
MPGRLRNASADNVGCFTYQALNRRWSVFVGFVPEGWDGVMYWGQRMMFRSV